MRHWKHWSTALIFAVSSAAIAQPSADDQPKGPPPADQGQPDQPNQPGPRNPGQQGPGQPGQPGQPNQRKPGQPNGPGVMPNPQPRGPMQPGQPNPQPQPQPTPMQQQRMEQFQRARVFIQPPGKKEKAAFLGVSGSPVPPVLREQLKMEKGVGLVVDFVDPKGPADEAGIKQYDVLHKLGDQLLINAHQFATLVRMHKPGDEVELTLIRHGESKHVKAKLTEREVFALDDTNPWGIPPGPWQDASGADVLMYTGMPGKINVQTGGAGGHGVVGVGGGSGGGGGFGGVSVGNPNFHAMVRRSGEGVEEMRWKDDSGEVAITNGKDGRRVEAKDKSGKMTFTGSIDTPEQMKVVPADVREKIQKMENTRPNIEGFPYPLHDIKGEIRVNTDQGEVRIVTSPGQEQPAPVQP